MQLPYLQFRPSVAAPSLFAPTSVVIGRTVAGAGLTLAGYATLRGDGEWIRIGANAYFAERATVHIADGVLPTGIDSDVTVGRYALVHACTLGAGVVVADAATVMDGAVVGPGALIAPGALVPPRKKLAGGFIYAGNPAGPVRAIGAQELGEAAASIRCGAPSPLVRGDDLPPPDMAPFVPVSAGAGPLYSIEDRAPHVPAAFVAPGSGLVGDVRIGIDAGVFFGCAVVAGGAHIAIGARTNIQDNSLLVTDRARGHLMIGDRVTVGHNVRMGSGVYEDDTLVGMGSIVGDGVVVERGGCIAAGAHVEPGTVVKAGWIWAGRPARAFRELKPDERESFAGIIAVYAQYSSDYRGGR